MGFACLDGGMEGEHDGAGFVEIPKVSAAYHLTELSFDAGIL